MKNKITIQDVAKKAGVSVTTVSFALNGKGRISQKTIETIQTAIDELGFIKNRSAASLRQSQSSLIGIVFETQLNDFFNLILNEIEQQLFVKDKHTFFCKINQQADLVKKLSIMVEMRCDGVILCLEESILEEAILFLSTNHLPFVVISQAVKKNNIPIVLSNSYEISKNATQNLLEAGHKKIAYLGGEINSVLRSERLTAYIESLMNNGLSFSAELIQDEAQLQKSEDLERFIARNPYVTAFICHDKKIAMALYIAAIKRGKRFNPNKNEHYFENSIQILSFDCDDSLLFQDFPIVWINANIKEITSKAINLLDHEMASS